MREGGWRRIGSRLGGGRTLLAGAVLCIGLLAASLRLTRAPVDYGTQVKPILNQKCISCHGGVKKKAGFSLLFREEALAPTGSGKPAIIPGDAAGSEFIRRLHHADPEERMPYRKAPLAQEEIDILTRWVEEGAPFDTHWAYLPVRQPDIPGGGWQSLFRRQSPQGIDRYIDEKLRDQGLERSPEADRRVLLRRLALDLTGMPAAEPIARTYLNDKSPGAYERLVDALLASPAYGERWASVWMDLARYADSKGYESDPARNIWRYRDWLIRAFNADMPYDRFLTEQIAGDLLPDATDEQLVATAFHRNTLTNDEGGTDNEEFRTSAVIDRVNTTWEAVLGTSFACVQCHSHPYDPFRQQEYYRFMAYFNDTRDEDSNMDYPLLREFKGRSRERRDSLGRWLSLHGSPGDRRFFQEFLRTCRTAVNSLTADALSNAAIWGSQYLLLRKSSSARIRRLDMTGMSRLLVRYRCYDDRGTLTLTLDSAGGKPLARLRPKNLHEGWNLMEVPLPAGTAGIRSLHLHYANDHLKSEEDNGIMFDWVAVTPSLPGEGLPGYERQHEHYLHLLDRPEADFTPILAQNPPSLHRPTRVFERGNWLVRKEVVQPGIPAVFDPAGKRPVGDRLALARWITDPANPLTARTMANRVWEQVFGTGLVETLEDFGSQGVAPTHPELLDYLAWSFMHDDGWSVKRLLRRIVVSETYRQRSEATAEALRKDPQNRYLGRAPRYRLSAEQIRDQALQAAGVLSGRMYGPSVMPYQPEGIWGSPYNSMRWVLSEGEDRYRRGLYTFIKRTSPYPSLLHFDGVAREVCVSRRIRTNTPLQALTLMNDSVYWDASVLLALSVCRDADKPVSDRIGQAYLRATGMEAGRQRLGVLERLYRETHDRMARRPEESARLLKGHGAPAGDSLGAAAMAVVANAILNLDEMVTRY